MLSTNTTNLMLQFVGSGKSIEDSGTYLSSDVAIVQLLTFGVFKLVLLASSFVESLLSLYALLRSELQV